MNEKTTTNLKTSRRPRNSVTQSFSSMEKVQAVLGIWTERIKPADVCREMGVTWMHIKHWQDRALEGMMQALETRNSLAATSALTPRLRALLEKRQGSEGMSRLEQKLAKLQETNKKKNENP